MATILVAHGAWAGGWSWKKVVPRLRVLGHRLVVPTQTGVGERVHLATHATGLSTHIADLEATMRCEGLDDFLLLGHSYGGMVATGLADRHADRVRALVYLDAFVPRHGQALFDLVGPAERARMLEAARTEGGGWRIPPNPMPVDTPREDLEWVLPRRVMQPLRAFSETLELSGEVERVPRVYVYCRRCDPTDRFAPFAHRARVASGWRCVEIDASHSPQVTAPDALADLLDRLARDFHGRASGDPPVPPVQSASSCPAVGGHPLP